MDDLLADFVAETREMLEASGGEIVAWEADPSDRARLDTISGRLYNLSEDGMAFQVLKADVGAIALGHPLGASGARLALTAVSALETHGGKRAIATMCIGVGQGIAALIELV